MRNFYGRWQYTFFLLELVRSEISSQCLLLLTRRAASVFFWVNSCPLTPTSKKEHVPGVNLFRKQNRWNFRVPKIRQMFSQLLSCHTGNWYIFMGTPGNKLKGSLSPPGNDIYGAKNDMQGASSKTKLSNLNLVISDQFVMLAGLAPTSNKEPLFRVHHAPWTTGIFCSSLSVRVGQRYFVASWC